VDLEEKPKKTRDSWPPPFPHMGWLGLQFFPEYSFPGYYGPEHPPLLRKSFMIPAFARTLWERGGWTHSTPPPGLSSKSVLFESGLTMHWLGGGWLGSEPAPPPARIRPPSLMHQGSSPWGRALGFAPGPAPGTYPPPSPPRLFPGRRY